MSFGEWLAARRSSEEESKTLSPEDAAILEKLARKVVEWKMTVPAIMFLESVKPLNYIGSQAMVFFEPFVQALFNLNEYDRVRSMLERRETIELLLLKIEELDAQALAEEREEKRKRRAENKDRGFWSRLFRRRRDSSNGGRPPQPPVTP